jgi:hypothetical protein
MTAPTVVLVFPDRATALSVAAQIPEMQIPGEACLRLRGHWGEVMVIGDFWAGGEWDEQGNEVSPPFAVPGWHVITVLNPGYELPAALAPYVVTSPEYPYPVFG